MQSAIYAPTSMEEMKIATKIRFSFHPLGEKDLLSTLPEFYRFAKGISREIKNLMRGTIRNMKVTIFECIYDDASPDNSMSQIVICFESTRLSLPVFRLSPADYLIEMVQAIRYQNIDFENHSYFSERYLLTGKNEEVICTIFIDRVIGFYEKNSKFCTGGNGNHLLFFEPLLA